MAQLALSGGGGVERDRPARDERVGHTWSVTSVDGGGVRRAGVCARDARDTGAACVKLYTLDMLKSDNIAV